MRPVAGLPELRNGRRYLAAYLGIMGPQDGVEMVLLALDVLVHRMGRRDLHVALLGFGDCYDELVTLSGRLGLTDYVTFTGRAGQRQIVEYLSTADIGLSPDPKSPLNDVSTMNKTMEYMSFAVPVVAFDLAETRVSAGDTAVYVEPTDDTADGAEQYAKAIAELLDDVERRVTMGLSARDRAVRELDWAPQRARYVSVFDRLLGRAPAAGPGDEHAQAADVRERFGHPVIDLVEVGALERHIRDRCAAAVPRP
jgi:glycosyltransferase involved in cell wall biosynthesis